MLYVISRNNNELIITVSLDSFWSQNSFLYFSLYLLILIVSTTSIYVLYKKPYDITARLFFIYIQLFAIAQNFKFLYLDDSYSLFATIAFIFSFNLFGIVLLHFHLTFPKPVSFYNRIKPLLKVIYSIGILFGITLTILLIRRNHIGSSDALSVFNTFSRWSISWMGLTVAFAFSVAIYQFITAKNRHTRKQLRLVVIGSAFGLVTPILFGIYPEIIWQLEREQHLLTLLEMTIGIGTYIMTSFLAIAIFRYRIWNIEPFIRQAILYGAATIIVYLSYVILIYLAASLFIQESGMIQFFILAASILIFLLLRDIIQRLIDRFFYRESYDSATVVEEFEKNLAGIYQMDELKSRIVQSLDKIFHFKSFVFAIKANNLTYNPVYLFRIDNYTKGKECEVTPEMDKLLRKSKIFSTEELRKKPILSEIANGELIVPLIDNNQPAGFFIIGPKLSEGSYSLQDIRVLSLLARRVIALIHTAILYQKDLDRKLLIERERTRIAMDIHDDVGASLTRISFMSELLLQKSDPKDLKQGLNEIADTSRQVTQEMNQIIWALNPKHDTFEGLIAYLRRFVLEYLEPTIVSCICDLPEKLPELSLNIEARRNIYLCIREALHNVVKHSGATKVWISLKMSEQGFIIVIKDDGTGFDPDTTGIYGNGLINMKKRMQDIGGELLIQSIEGEGTEISVSVLI